jgi:hypothetical protein
MPDWSEMPKPDQMMVWVSSTNCATWYLAGPAHVPRTSDTHVAKLKKRWEKSDFRKIGAGGTVRPISVRNKKCQSPGGDVADLLRGNPRKQSCGAKARQNLNQALARPVAAQRANDGQCDLFAPIVPVRWNLHAHAACLGWALHCY